MNAIRLALFTLGCLLAVIAGAAGFGIAWSVMVETRHPSVEAMAIALFVVLFLSVSAFAAFRASRAIEHKRLIRERTALQSSDADELLCPHCDDSALVQGPTPASLFAKCYDARCVTCGYRTKICQEEWLRLPLPEGGDAFETPKDREHVMRRTAMTTGQGIVVAISIIVFFSVVFVLFGVDEIQSDIVLTFAFLPVVYGSWRFGRWLFPPGGN